MTDETREEFVNAAVERSMREILEDIDGRIVPESVASFAELHQYTYANEYGGLADPDTWNTSAAGMFGPEVEQAICNEVRDRVDMWLKTRDIPPARSRRGTEVRQRQHQVGVRLRPDEMEHLQQVAARDGISPAEVLRTAFHTVHGTGGR